MSVNNWPSSMYRSNWKLMECEYNHIPTNFNLQLSNFFTLFNSYNFFNSYIQLLVYAAPMTPLDCKTMGTLCYQLRFL